MVGVSKKQLLDFLELFDQELGRNIVGSIVILLVCLIFSFSR